MADIFREIDEDLRAERYQKLWRRWGGAVIGLAVAVVIGTAGYLWWRGHEAEKRAEQSQRYAAALESAQKGERDAAALGFAALARDSSPGYALLSRLSQAGALVQAGKLAEALPIYDAVAADGSVAREFRDLAVITAALHRVGTEDRAAVSARVEPFSSDAHPFRFTAREILAMAALKAGDADAAKQFYRGLADSAEAPQSQRARAAEMLAALGG